MMRSVANSPFLESGNLPLIQRDPRRFWKGLSVVLASVIVMVLASVIVMVLLWLLVR